MEHASLDRSRPVVPDLNDPERWLHDLFTSKAARHGAIIRRKARDIERFVGWDRFLAELEHHGYRAIENAGQVVIFCNRAPIRPVWG